MVEKYGSPHHDCTGMYMYEYRREWYINSQRTVTQNCTQTSAVQGLQPHFNVHMRPDHQCLTSRCVPGGFWGVGWRRECTMTPGVPVASWLWGGRGRGGVPGGWVHMWSCQWLESCHHVRTYWWPAAYLVLQSPWWLPVLVLSQLQLSLPTSHSRSYSYKQKRSLSHVHTMITIHHATVPSGDWHLAQGALGFPGGWDHSIDACPEQNNYKVQVRQQNTK